jgi:hypothetical protein
MSVRTVLTDEIAEATTPVITFKIVDANGVGFKPTALTLTLYSYRTGSVINSRDAQPALDQNGVSTDASGNTAWQMSAADTPIADSPPTAIETHVALFEWTWNGGQFSGKHEIEHRIRNMTSVP